MKPVLSEEEHRRFVRLGYCVVREAVPPEVVAKAVAALDSGVELRGHGRRGGAPPPAPPVLSACVTDRVWAALAELVGEGHELERHQRLMSRPRVYSPQAAWRPPEAHTDNDYPCLVPESWTLGLIIYLRGVSPRSGGFITFPGSHLRYRALMHGTPLALRGVERLPENQGEFEEFAAHAGDALIFHHLLGHSASENLSDPKTRHALFTHYDTVRRVAPGDKPFERMSTVEKANSTRFLSGPGWSPHPPLGISLGAPLDRALSRGAALPKIAAYDLLRYRGATECFFAGPDEPAVLRRARTTDWVSWEVSTALRFGKKAISSVALFVDGPKTVLLVGVSGGRGAATKVFVGEGLDAWTEAGELPGRALPSAQLDVVTPLSEAQGLRMLFHVSPQKPRQVLAARGHDWPDVSRWAAASPVAQVPGSAAPLDLRLHPVLGRRRMVLVADLPEGPVCMESDDGETFDGPVRALRFDGRQPPRQLRLYARARGYWLVSYLSAGRLLWGAVDWEAGEPALRPLASSAALREALHVVGLI